MRMLYDGDELNQQAICATCHSQGCRGECQAAVPVHRTEKRDPSTVRRFDTGAVRDTDTSKFDYDGFYSPLVMHCFGSYMHRHRLQTDGRLRDSDNWQLGIMPAQYLKSAWRHLVDLWALHRGYQVYKERTDKGEVTHMLAKVQDKMPSNWLPCTIQDSACGILFNIQGLLHEFLKKEE